jgi:endonuclease YncB( thermonuclease family)
LSYSIEEGSLVISGPTWLWVGDEATFTVTSRGSPVEGVIVEVDGGVEESDENGAVSFSFARSGTFTVSASKEGYEGASMPVVVTAPSEDALRYEVAAFVTEVIDGDTVDAGIVKLATGLDPKGEIFEGTIETIRFGGGIDAPELEPLEPGGTETTELVENLIPPGTLIYLDLNDLSRGGRTGRPYRGSLERLIAVIYTVIDGRWVNVNAEVLRWGMREYPDHDWLFYRYYPSEWDPDEWLEENYPYVRG